MQKIKELTNEQKLKALELIEQGIARKEIAKAIGTRYSNLKAFLDKENIPKKKLGIPYEHYEPIFELYNSGLTLQQIHDKHYPQFTTDQINYICREHGITRPNGKVAHLNHDYFLCIDNQDKAYWLGLIFADGCITESKGKRSIALSLQHSDKYLIEEFAKAVETDLTVKDYRNDTGFQRKDGKPHIESRLVLRSKNMIEHLKGYGIVPRKSLILKELPNIEEKYMRHFIRGFFDGNGSITYERQNGLITPKVLFYSTHDLCEEINQYLHEKLEVNLHKVIDKKESKVSFITYGKIQDVIKIYEYFYEDCNHCLLRKKKKFEEYISEYRDNRVA